MNSKYKMFLYIYIFAIPFVVDGYINDRPIDTTGAPKLYDTNLKFYDSSNQASEPFDLYPNDTNLADSGFDKNNKIKVIIPDWQEHHNETWITEMIGNYSANPLNYNIIVLDWQNLSKQENYFFVMKRIGHIAAGIINYLIFLNKDNPLVNVINKKVHIIGNGIGAHIAALVGSHFKNHTIDRITGLDPASSGFENALRKHRLDKTDAEFVDVIHTCVDMIGIKQAVGNVDFYPNAGMCDRQPGCEWTGHHSSHSLYNCGHSKAAQYMSQTINNATKFKATQDECGKENKTAAYMGEGADRNIQGRYILKIKNRKLLNISK